MEGLVLADARGGSPPSRRRRLPMKALHRFYENLSSFVVLCKLFHNLQYFIYILHK